MHTAVPEITSEVISGYRSLLDLSRADTISQMVHLHQFHRSHVDAGGVWLVELDNRMEVMEPPTGIFDQATAAVAALDTLQVTIPASRKEYLEPMTREGDERDLLNFWASAALFFSQVNERQLLGGVFYYVRPKLVSEVITLPGLLGGEQAMIRKGEIEAREAAKLTERVEQAARIKSSTVAKSGLWGWLDRFKRS